MTTASLAETPAEEFEPHWVSRAAFPVLVGCLGLTHGALATAVYLGWIWLAIPLVLLASHLMHGCLIGFHEASHGLLRENRKLNEIDGVLLGVLSFMSFSLYRAAHQSHHMYLGTERDEELWPFVDTTKPRWVRVLAAFGELFGGILFTPLLFLRTFFREGSPIRSRKVRRRIWAELILIVVVWTAVFFVVATTGTWKYFLWLYVVPAVIAGNLQSWRKYIEHVGLTGSTVRSATRSIVAPGPIGRVVAFTLLHEPFHGVHHQHAGLPHAELPGKAVCLEPKDAGEKPPFPSYWHAFLDLFRCLADPRVGPQWQRQGRNVSVA